MGGAGKRGTEEREGERVAPGNAALLFGNAFLALADPRPVPPTPFLRTHSPIPLLL